MHDTFFTTDATGNVYSCSFQDGLGQCERGISLRLTQASPYRFNLLRRVCLAPVLPNFLLKGLYPVPKGFETDFIGIG